MNQKVLITNLSALTAKYGAGGVKKISAAVTALIAADKARGLQTRLIAVDRAADMKTVKGPRVTKAGDPKQHKKAVDAIYNALAPDYLVLLGAPDVLPHQDLRNPVFGGEDVDEFAYGDVPYACAAPYSQEPRDFIGPTRVVGRLPDLTGGTDPAYLVDLLHTAATWKSRPAADYADYFAITAAVWKSSTARSVERLFGNSKSLQLSPPKGPKWTAAQLAPRAHFINCHGVDADPSFYGQTGNNFPQAHFAGHVAGKISEGTVAAVECCYGAELYDPALVGGQAGLCSTYLEHGAYGYLGSSTIAYGPAEGNGAADLLCQYFLRRVKAGASLGRATLEARLEFAGGAAELDPIDLKTLAQFHLLGDPSIHPVIGGGPPVALAVPRGLAGFAKAKQPEIAAAALARSDRRRQLTARGARIGETQSCAVASTTEPGRALSRVLAKMAAAMQITAPQVLSFSIETPGSPLAKTRTARARRVEAAPSAFYVVMGGEPTTPGSTAKTRGSQTARSAVKAAPVVRPFVALVAREVGGQIVSYREMHRR